MENVGKTTSNVGMTKAGITHGLTESPGPEWKGHQVVKVGKPKKTWWESRKEWTAPKTKAKSTVGLRKGSPVELGPLERGMRVPPAGGSHRTVVPTTAKGNWWFDRKEWTKKKK